MWLISFEIFLRRVRVKVIAMLVFDVFHQLIFRPKLVKKVCESKSICYLWRGIYDAVHGVAIEEVSWISMHNHYRMDNFCCFRC